MDYRKGSINKKERNERILTCRNWWWVDWGLKRWMRGSRARARCRRRTVPSAIVRQRCRRWIGASRWVQLQNQPPQDWRGSNWILSATAYRSWMRSSPSHYRLQSRDWGNRQRWQSVPSQDRSKEARNYPPPHQRPMSNCRNNQSSCCCDWTKLFLLPLLKMMMRIRREQRPWWRWRWPQPTLPMTWSQVATFNRLFNRWREAKIKTRAQSREERGK